MFNCRIRSQSLPRVVVSSSKQRATWACWYRSSSSLSYVFDHKIKDLASVPEAEFLERDIKAFNEDLKKFRNLPRGYSDTRSKFHDAYKAAFADLGQLSEMMASRLRSGDESNVNLRTHPISTQVNACQKKFEQARDIAFRAFKMYGEEEAMTDQYAAHIETQRGRVKQAHGFLNTEIQIRDCIINQSRARDGEIKARISRHRANISEMDSTIRGYESKKSSTTWWDDFRNGFMLVFYPSTDMTYRPNLRAHEKMIHNLRRRQEDLRGSIREDEKILGGEQETRNSAGSLRSRAAHADFSLTLLTEMTDSNGTWNWKGQWSWSEYKPVNEPLAWQAARASSLRKRYGSRTEEISNYIRDHLDAMDPVFAILGAQTQPYKLAVHITRIAILAQKSPYHKETHDNIQRVLKLDSLPERYKSGGGNNSNPFMTRRPQPVPSGESLAHQIKELKGLGGERPFQRLPI